MVHLKQREQKGSSEPWETYEPESWTFMAGRVFFLQGQAKRLPLKQHIPSKGL